MRTKAVDARQPFRFGWEVPVDGYRCEPGVALDDQLREQDQKPELFLVEAAPLGVARMVRRHRTLDENTGLFLNFAAQIDVTPEGILAFANQYGTLGGKLNQRVRLGKRKAKHESPVYPGEAIAAWSREVNYLRRLLPLWDHDRKSEIRFTTTPGSVDAEWSSGSVRTSEKVVIRALDPDTYERLENKPAEIARHYLRTKVNGKLLEHPVTGRLVDDKARGGDALFMVPASLIAAIWLQFAQAIEGDRRYRICKNCGRWFEVGAGGRRIDAEACDSNCRAAFAYSNSKRKGKKR